MTTSPLIEYLVEGHTNIPFSLKIMANNESDAKEQFDSGDYDDDDFEESDSFINIQQDSVIDSITEVKSYDNKYAKIELRVEEITLELTALAEEKCLLEKQLERGIKWVNTKIV